MATEQSPGTRKPGSQSALRQRNTQLIIDTLARRGPTTQATLSRITGLSTGTISNLVKLLESKEVVTATPTVDSGRRALAIGLRGQGQVVAGIDIDRTSLRVILCSLGHEVLAEEALRLPIGHSPESTFKLAADLVALAMQSSGTSPDQLANVGLSISSAVEHGNVLLIPDPLLPNWEGVSIKALATQYLDKPCHIDNDANLGALAQVTFGPFKEVSNLAFIKVSRGIGAGLLVHGEIVRGATGTAGEIGHTLVVPNGLPCRCGNRGCLETVASTTRILNDIGRSARNRELSDENLIVEMSRKREPAAIRALTEAGYALGISLASLSSLLNPSTVVIGGALAEVGTPLLEPVYRGFHRHCMADLAHRTNLVMNQLGDRTECLGAAALAINRTQVSQD